MFWAKNDILSSACTTYQRVRDNSISEFSQELYMRTIIIHVILWMSGNHILPWNHREEHLYSAGDMVSYAVVHKQYCKE